MDIDKVFPGRIIRKRDIRSIELSYRRYGRLKAIEKKIFDGDKDNYTPMVWKLALHIKATLNKPFKAKYFNIAYQWITTGKWLELINENQLNGNIYCLNLTAKNEAYVYKEFTFEGFIHIEDYQLKDKFGYIMSNRMICGHYLVLPIKLWSNIKVGKHLMGKYDHYQDLLGKYGIPGITKYKYSDI